MLFDPADIEFDHCLVEPKQARSVESILEILRAAAEILTEDPQSLSVTTIATRAGMPRGTIYRYFEGVEPIVSTLASSYERRAVEAVDLGLRGIDQAADLALSVASLAYAAIDVIDNDPLAKALFVSAYSRDALGRIVEDAIRTIAALGVDRTIHLLMADRTRSAHLDRAALLLSWLRVALETAAPDAGDRQGLVAAYTDLCFTAAQVNLDIPSNAGSRDDVDRLGHRHER